MQERLQKFLSGAGVASRRHAEDMILAGKIKVNGKIIRELGTKIDPDKDKVSVNGKQISRQQFVYLALYKPKKCLTTRSDPKKRKTVYDFLPPEMKNVVWPVGRLDYMTEGLLVMTNDGELTQELAHPSKQHEKEYEVILDKELSEGRIKKLEEGMVIDGRKAQPAKVRVSGNTVYLTVHEGWNHLVRKMFAAFGYTVRNLKRIRVGKLRLKDLQLGQYKMIGRKDII